MGQLPSMGIHLSNKDQFDRRGRKLTPQQNYAQPQPAPQQAPAPQQPPMPQMAPAQFNSRDSAVSQQIQFYNAQKRARREAYSTALQQNQAAKLANMKSKYGPGVTEAMVRSINENGGDVTKGMAAYQAADNADRAALMANNPIQQQAAPTTQPYATPAMPNMRGAAYDPQGQAAVDMARGLGGSQGTDVNGISLALRQQQLTNTEPDAVSRGNMQDANGIYQRQGQLGRYNERGGVVSMNSSNPEMTAERARSMGYTPQYTSAIPAAQPPVQAAGRFFPQKDSLGERTLPKLSSPSDNEYTNRRLAQETMDYNASMDNATAHNMTMPEWQANETNLLAQENAAKAIATNAEAGLNTSMGNRDAGKSKLTEAEANAEDQRQTRGYRNDKTNAETKVAEEEARAKAARTKFLQDNAGKSLPDNSPIPSDTLLTPPPPRVTPEQQANAAKSMAEARKLIADVEQYKNQLPPVLKARFTMWQTLAGKMGTQDASTQKWIDDERKALDAEFKRLGMSPGAANSAASATDDEIKKQLGL